MILLKDKLNKNGLINSPLSNMKKNLRDEKKSHQMSASNE